MFQNYGRFFAFASPSSASYKAGGVFKALRIRQGEIIYQI